MCRGAILAELSDAFRQHAGALIDLDCVLEFLEAFYARCRYAQDVSRFAGSGKSRIDSGSHLTIILHRSVACPPKNLSERGRTLGAQVVSSRPKRGRSLTAWHARVTGTTKGKTAELRAGLNGKARPYNGNCDG